MSINKLFLIISLVAICICDDNKTPPKYIEELTCGKDSPEDEEDCTKYGTGSGMLCCWVQTAKGSGSGSCYLIPESKANEAGIDGSFEFKTGEKKYWSCGNKSNYISINILLFLLVLFSF